MTNRKFFVLIFGILLFSSFSTAQSTSLEYWFNDTSTGPFDYSGNNYDGTTSGSLTKGVNSPLGSAYDYDGNDDIAETPSISQAPTSVHYQLYVPSKFDGTNSDSFHLPLTGDSGNELICFKDGCNSDISGLTLGVSKSGTVGIKETVPQGWNNVTVVYDSSETYNWRIYLNGQSYTVYDGGQGSISSFSATNWNIMSRPSNSEYFTGKTDLLKFYDTSLTDFQVSNLNQCSSISCNTEPSVDSLGTEPSNVTVGDDVNVTYQVSDSDGNIDSVLTEVFFSNGTKINEITKTYSSSSVTDKTVDLYTPSSEDNYTIYVTATDDAGASSVDTLNSYAQDVDSTPPSITVHNPVDGNTYDSDVSLEVSANESVSTWKYNIDGGSNNTFSPNTTVSGLSDGTHSINVFATDSAGNTGSSSVSFSVDTTAPSFTWVEPTNSTYSGDVPVEVTGTADSWEYLLDSGAWTGFTPNATLSGLSDGQHNIKVRANDSLDNSNTKGPRYFSVDNTPPSTSSNATTGTWLSKSSYAVELTATDSGSSIANVSYRVNGGSYTNSSTNPTDLTINTEGNNTLEYFAWDTAGNKESVNTEYVALDSSDPTLSILNPTNTTFSTPEIDLNVTGSDSPSGIDEWEYSKDGGGYVTFTPNTSLTWVYGQHDVRVRANDGAGNTAVDQVYFFQENQSADPGYVDTNKSIIEGCPATPTCTDSQQPQKMTGLDGNSSYSVDWDVNATEEGVYKTLIVANSTNPNVGFSTSSTYELTIGNESTNTSNSAPSASFTASTTDLSVDVDGSGSSDSDGSIQSWEWDWTDDGSYDATGSTASHTYGSGGDYTIRLRVTDDDGATSTATATVSVSDSTDSGGGGSGGDDSDGGTGGGGGDTNTTDSASLDGSYVKLLAPHIESRFYGDLVRVAENDSDGTTYSICAATCSEHTIEVNGIVDDQTVNVSIDGSSQVLSEMETIEIDNRDHLLSEVVDVKGAGGSVVFSKARYGATPDAFYGLNYTINGSGSVELQSRRTGGSDWSTVQTYTEGSDVTNKYVNLTQELDHGIYEARLRLNVSGNSTITAPTGFYMGYETAVLKVTNPENGEVVHEPVVSQNKFNLNGEVYSQKNGTTSVGAYYQYEDGTIYSEGENVTVSRVDDNDGIIEEILVFFESLTWYDAGGYLDLLEVEEDAIVQFNGTIIVGSQTGEYTAYINGSNNESGREWNATSIGKTLTWKPNKTEYDQERDEEIQSRTGKTPNRDLQQDNSTNQTTTVNGSTVLFDTPVYGLYYPINSQTFEAEDLSSFSIEFIFDQDHKGNATVNEALVIEENGSVVERMFNKQPAGLQHELSVDQGQVNWSDNTNYTWHLEYWNDSSMIYSTENRTDGESYFTVKEKEDITIGKCADKEFYSAIGCYLNPDNYGQNIQVGFSVGLILAAGLLSSRLIAWVTRNSALTGYAGLVSVAVVFVYTVLEGWIPQIFGGIAFVLALIVAGNWVKQRVT